MKNIEKEFLIFKKYNEKLLNLFNKKYTIINNYSDNFTFMLLCYLGKQKTHLESVLSLVNSNSYSDAMIISRNMVEGVGIIYWTSKDMDKRALRWRNFCVVTDYRIALNNQNYDKSKVDKIIFERLEQFGEEYLLEKLKQKKVQKSNLPIDPYKKHWLFDDNGKKLGIYDLFDEQNKNLYDIYSDMSDWVHWNINRIGTKIIRANSQVVYSENSIKDGCLALSSAFLSMHYFMQVTSKHLKLNYESLLENISENYKSDLNKSGT